MICNIIPYLDCSNKRSFVQMIKLINGKFVVVFNDGKLYTTDNYKENIWNGPLENSMPKRYVPLRMVNTTPMGNMIVGVGYDNRCYIKLSEKDFDLTAEWQEIEDISKNIKVIYLAYYFDKLSNKARKMIINDKGRIMLQQDDTTFRTINSTYPALLKVFYNHNGYILGIDKNFRLGSFDEKGLENNTYAVNVSINEHNYINDIIYDNDYKLIGITLNFNKNIMEYKKQLGIGYENKFYNIRKE